MTEPTIDEIIGSLERWYDGDKGADPDQTRAKLQALISDQVAKARIDESSLWYNEWGNGTNQIGDGSWEDYYAHRIQTLKGEE